MTGEDREELVRWVEGKIAQLKAEIKILENILKIVKGEEIGAQKEVLPSDVKVIAVQGNVLANVIEGDDYVRVIFTEGFPQDSPLVKSFLLKVLDDNKREGYIKKYEVLERRGYIMELRLEGVSSSKVLKELELSLRYIWKNLGASA